MAYGKIWRGQWLMEDNTTEVTVDISDTAIPLLPGDDPIVIPLQMGAKPLRVTVIDNDRNKLTSVRGKQAVIEIETESGIDIMTFTGYADNRFYVEAYISAEYIFKGFLSTADLNQPYLSNPQKLVLTALDGLGLLRDVALKDFDGDNPTGKNKISKYLAWCLAKTGLSLNINVINNLRHGSGSLTNQVLFSSSGDYFVTSGLITNFFYAGQEIAVTGSVSNNTTYHVESVDNTGLATQVNVEENITTGENTLNVTLTDTTSAGHFYDTVYIDAKTFEKEIGESEDCRTVLEKILGYDCTLFQYLGEWWIVRTDEYDENQFYRTIFDDQGDHVSDESPTTYNKLIGSTEDLYFAQADQSLERDRPNSFAKLTYNYNYPAEVPCNKDFARGDFIANVSSTEKTYTLDCWTLREGAPGFYGTVDGTTATIHKIFNLLSYETERYVVLTPRTTFENSSINAITYVESEGIPIDEKDRFSASVQWRLNLGIASGTNGSARLFRCVLNGDDGSWWILGEDTTGDGVHKWFNTSLWTVNSAKGVVSLDFNSLDEEEWQTISWDAPPAPVTGTLYFWLNQFNQLNNSDDDKEIWYSGFSFTYTPYINGSYQTYTGQHQKVTRPETGYLAKTEDEVFVSDSPKKLFKGAMFVLVNSVYKLTNRFYTANVFPSGPPSGDYSHPYGETQIRSVFNQVRNANVVYTGTVYGLAASWPDLLHKYRLTDAHPAANSRYFICIAYDQDWKSGEMNNAILIEVYDRSGGKIYSDDREFKYLTR